MFAEDSNQSNRKTKPNGIRNVFGANFFGNIRTINSGNFVSGTVVNINGANWTSEKTAKAKAKSKAENSKKVTKVTESRMTLRSRTKK